MRAISAECTGSDSIPDASRRCAVDWSRTRQSAALWPFGFHRVADSIDAAPVAWLRADETDRFGGSTLGRDVIRQNVLDVVEQTVDRRLPSRPVRQIPALCPEAGAHRSLDLLDQRLRRPDHDPDAGTFFDDGSSTGNSRGPGVVALQCRRCGQGNGRVYERV